MDKAATLSRLPSPAGRPFKPDTEFLVACQCASWCATCRNYQNGFFTLPKNFRDVAFVWLDVESDADVIGHLEVENFPTLLIQKGDAVLFFGPVLPDHNQLRWLIQSLKNKSTDEVAEYIRSTPERQSWQETCNLRQRLHELRPAS